MDDYADTADHGVTGGARTSNTVPVGVLGACGWVDGRSNAVAVRIAVANIAGALVTVPDLIGGALSEAGDSADPVNEGVAVAADALSAIPIGVGAAIDSDSGRVEWGSRWGKGRRLDWRQDGRFWNWNTLSILNVESFIANALSVAIS